MYAGLDRRLGSRAVFRAGNDINIAAFEKTHQVGCVFLPDNRQLHDSISIVERLFDREVNDESEQNRSKNRTHNQGRGERPAIAKIVDNLL